MKRKFLILMFLVGFGTSYAQMQCGNEKPSSCHKVRSEGRADNNTYVCSPANGQFFDLEDEPVYVVCPGSQTGSLYLQVFHRQGFKSNVNDPLTASEKIYTALVDGPCQVRMNRDIPNLCGRTGFFQAYVTVEHGDRGSYAICDEDKYIVLKTDFTIKPDPTIGKLSPHYQNLTVCPGNDVELWVDSTVANQNGARWYTFPDMNYLGSGYTYRTNIQQLEVQNYYVSYVKNYTRENRSFDEKSGDTYVEKYTYEDCTLEGLRMPFVVTGLDLDALLSPDPRVEFVCKASHKSITIKNPHQYTGVRWYSDAGRTNLLHVGETYTAFFSESTRLFTEYYNDYGSCETTSALPGVVEVYVAQKDIQEHIASLGWFSYDEKVILDYRDVDGATCESNPAFYLDLTDYEVKNQSVFLGAGGIGADVNLKTHWESNYLVGNESVMLADGESYKGFTADLYSELNPGEKDVCANHVGKPKGSYGRRTYRQMGHFTFTYKVPTGPATVIEETSTCPANLKRMEVRTVGLSPDTGDVLCPPISIDLLTQVDPDVLSSCQRYGTQNVCPGGRQQIGPSEAEILSWYVGNLPPTIVQLNTRYKWNQKNGLSTYDIANPDVIHEKMENPMGSYTRYELLITYPDNSVVNYCEIVYKCRNCGETTVEPTLPELNGL